MKINVLYRDFYPKMGLDRKYIGDGFPVRVVEVSDDIFFDYVRRPCVYQGFFDNPKLLARRYYWSKRC